MASFYSWQMSSLRSLGGGPVVAGRLQAAAPIAIRDIATGEERTPPAGPFELFGPGDVVRLAPGIISRRFPSPASRDAEETKRAMVEFADPDALDLPWRYSPEVDAGFGVRPWLVVVVGLPGEITVSRDGKVALSPAVQAAHPLGQSQLWAHVHEVGTSRLSRILSPLDLAAKTLYVACLVPAFVVEPDGQLRDAWPSPAGGVAVLPCYDNWSFSTGEAGDFPEIASRLEATTPSRLGDAFGRAKVRYERRGRGDPAEASLAAAGALTRPTVEAAASEPVEPWIASEIEALRDNVPTPDGRWVLTSPRYHAPFTPPGEEPGTGWSGALDTDPRDRGAAGLGAWAAIAWQDRIGAAASTKAGDLAIARDRIGHLALGLEASRSMWRRHVPDDPVGRLAMLGPVLGRLPAKQGGSVLDQIAGRTPLMARALWSSAARRALRPGPARNALAKPGAGRLESVIEHASKCPESLTDPEDLPITRDADKIFHGTGIEIEFDVDDLWAVRGLLEGLDGKPEPCRSIAPDKLGELVASAVDPTVGRPLVVDRVLGTLPGVFDIGPIEIEPELDLPLWSFLANASPDWLLPGIGDLPEDRVVGLATNPAFVEALLVGANHQTLGELRWRNFPIAGGWSPLRKFWQRAGGRLDIVPIRQWPADTPFGGPALNPPDIGIETVVVFRTQLFRRYPATVVYLYKDNDWTPPDANTPLAEADKVFPTFTGAIGPDVFFFGFPVAPEALKTHWVVLEEPPSGYRFYSTKVDPVTGIKTAMPDHATNNGAEYGSGTFAVPVRVMIGRLFEEA